MREQRAWLHAGGATNCRPVARATSLGPPTCSRSAQARGRLIALATRLVAWDKLEEHCPRHEAVGRCAILGWVEGDADQALACGEHRR